MAILCRSLGLLFIMTPRTGSSAVGRVLREQFGGAWIPPETRRDGRGRMLVPRKHCTRGQLLAHRVLERDEAEALVTCATVRNPFDSLLSLYWKRRSVPEALLADPASWYHRRPREQAEARYCRRHSFPRWIRRRLLPVAAVSGLGLYRPSMFLPFTEGADVVLRFERLEEDLNELLGRLGVTRRLTLPSVNPTPARPRAYRGQYSPLTRMIVTLAFRGDLRRYAYRY